GKGEELHSERKRGLRGPGRGAGEASPEIRKTASRSPRHSGQGHAENLPRNRKPNQPRPLQECGERPEGKEVRRFPVREAAQQAGTAPDISQRGHRGLSREESRGVQLEPRGERAIRFSEQFHRERARRPRHHAKLEYRRQDRCFGVVLKAKRVYARETKHWRLHAKDVSRSRRER